MRLGDALGGGLEAVGFMSMVTEPRRETWTRGGVMVVFMIGYTTKLVEIDQTELNCQLMYRQS